MDIIEKTFRHHDIEWITDYKGRLIAEMLSLPSSGRRNQYIISILFEEIIRCQKILNENKCISAGEFNAVLITPSDAMREKFNKLNKQTN